MAGIREIKDPINAQGLEDIIYNFQYLYLKLVALSGGQDVEQMLADLERLIREANEAMESYEVLEPRLIAAAEDAEAQAEAARIQAEYVASVKPAIDYFTSQQTNLQNQINQLVVNGDSSPEAAQARVGYNGTTYTSLKSRLDEEMKGVVNGGENLISGTNQQGHLIRYTGGSAPDSVVSYVPDIEKKEQFVTVLTANANSNLGNTFGVIPAATYVGNTLENGKTYCLSFEARTNKASGFPLNLIRMINTVSPNINVPSTVNISQEWTRYSSYFVWDRDTNVSTRPLIATGQPVNIGDTLEIRDLQINKGQLPTVFNSRLVKSNTNQALSGTDDLTYMTPLKVLQNFNENTQKFISSSEPDFNNVTKNGNYLMVGTNGLINAPNNTHTYYLSVYNRTSNDFATQFAKRVGTNEYFTRTKTAPNSSVWTEWQPVTLFKSTTAQAQAGTDDLTYMTPLKTSQSIQRKTGDLNTLGTIEKNDLVAAINEVLQSVSNFKSTIAGAITDKGINTPATANSTTMANNIALIGQPRQASGIVNVVTESLPFSFYDMSATEDANYVTVSGLNFRPRRIVVFDPNDDIPSVTEYSLQLAVLDDSIRIYRINGSHITTLVSNYKNNQASAFVNNGGFRLPVDGSGSGWEWYAYEY